MNSVLAPIKPSQVLRSGYIPVIVGDDSAWIFVDAHQSIDDGDAGAVKHFQSHSVQTLLARLASTFTEFSMTAAEWEADLRATANPVTALQLWRTAADVFDYYTRDKKLPWGARADYFWLILRFFNSPGTCLDSGIFNMLTLGRAARVVAEMGCYYRCKPW